MNLFCQSLMIIINKNPNYSQTHIHSIKETLALFDARAATIKLIYMIILGPPPAQILHFHTTTRAKPETTHRRTFI